ncbi:MAG: hypothetical protein H6558_10320 [Lewinellaceae bacterium]|nr:hypothetical protein [Lewinellaceae bacterium]MCB9289824.1 hypothetical protein [Lewinellaceae bacterium]
MGLATSLFGQSPHGAGFKANCSDCHSSISWEIDADTLSFNHDATAFPLAGHHTRVDCRQCHETLIFREASSECISCHTDIHRMTVGSDCARCHTPENWLVDNITELHQDNGFPLLGAHAALSCDECHVSESALEFNRIGNECLNCHLEDFAATTNPNHQGAGFSVNCEECHRADGFDWTSESINHDFFPLEKGHDISDCAQCHAGGDFSNTPTDCVACHQADYENTSNPNHQGADIPTACAECHTTDVGWMPADFAQHDGFFPIYSGAHAGEWSQCADCHNNPSDYTQFTCTNCHTNPQTDEEHSGVNGYAYDNLACLACHPFGDADNTFDHNSTNFPLTGGHLETECIQCHANGYQGTPTECEACHTTDYNETTNPNHQELGLPTDCASCHTTDPGWIPAGFDIHNDFYALNGAHADIANDCATCHNGDYTNTPNTCNGCHADDYAQTTNPNHSALQFSTDCATCHSETAWIPSSFDHNTIYPIRGAHVAIANDCDACHNGDYSNTPNTCYGCHAGDYSQTNNPNHSAAGFPTDCASCHSENAWEPADFDHDGMYFPIYSGRHNGKWDDCADCHTSPGDYSIFSCTDCHAHNNSQQLANEHNEVSGYVFDSNACYECHPTGHE